MIDSLSSEELQFIKAVEKYKSENNKHFLSWTEVLKIVRSLGYKKLSKKPQGLPAVLPPTAISTLKRKAIAEEPRKPERFPVGTVEEPEEERIETPIVTQGVDRLGKFDCQEDVCRGS